MDATQTTPRTRFAVVKASELGSRCWVPERFLGACWKCRHYPACKYPERVASAEYDAARDRLSEAGRTLAHMRAEFARQWPESEDSKTAAMIARNTGRKAGA